GIDRSDARLRERAVGRDLDLVAEERAGAAAELADREREEPDRHLLAGRDDHVHLAIVRIVLDLARELEQAVGLSRHRGDDDGDLMTRGLGREAARRDVLDPLDVADRGAAVFLDDQHARAAAYWIIAFMATDVLVVLCTLPPGDAAAGIARAVVE